jgi:hypothetical protein
MTESAATSALAVIAKLATRFGGAGKACIPLDAEAGNTNSTASRLCKQSTEERTE